MQTNALAGVSSILSRYFDVRLEDGRNSSTIEAILVITDNSAGDPLKHNTVIGYDNARSVSVESFEYITIDFINL